MGRLTNQVTPSICFQIISGIHTIEDPPPPPNTPKNLVQQIFKVWIIDGKQRSGWSSRIIGLISETHGGNFRDILGGWGSNLFGQILNLSFPLLGWMPINLYFLHPTDLSPRSFVVRAGYSWSSPLVALLATTIMPNQHTRLPSSAFFWCEVCGFCNCVSFRFFWRRWQRL